MLCEPQANHHEDVARHVACCVRCQTEVAGLAQLVADLRVLGSVTAPATLSDGHLGGREIEQFVTTTIVGVQQGTWQRHVQDCDECRRHVVLHRARLALLRDEGKP